MVLVSRSARTILAALAIGFLPLPNLLAQNVDDFTTYTYSVPSAGLGTFAELPVERTFAQPIKTIKVTIVDGQADDIGYVGNLLVTTIEPSCAAIGSVSAPVDVTSEVAVNGATASLLLRAQENCCCVTGWGSATQGDRRDAKLHWEVSFDGGLELAIDHTDPLITTKARVSGGRVLTVSDLALHLTSNDPNVSAAGVSITLQSDRGTADNLFGPAKPTDAAGQAAARVTTRDQSADSTITASNSDIDTTQPAQITWLPADYESDFLITCYVISDENDFLDTKLEKGVCGLPPDDSYHSGFIRDVKRQGSGKALNGKIVHWAGHGCYEILPCAMTSTGACAQEGVTIAVDPSVIPRKSNVNVAILGDRVAQDGGDWINTFHIDNFRGMDRAGCNAFGRQHSKVTFLSYGQ